ncbi:MAG: hypothetical protein HOQ24_15565 [Mycobacteriaceae bacterium]|nr:hypothetical protein [Mycobacteriaceae bacterium]
MSEDEQAPDWCGYFNPREYSAFRAAVQGAVSSYGLDDVCMDGGEIEMITGDDLQESWLSLDGLAALCRADQPEEWDSICFRRISDWVEGWLHREWLVKAPFTEVEPLLRLWRLTEKPESLCQDGRPDDPDEPFSIPLAEELYLSLIADVPELEEASESSVYVPNSAVQAWQRSHDDLLELVKRRLRGLPPPTWSTWTVTFTNYQGPTEVELYVASAAPEAGNAPVSAWFLLIDEVFPHPLPRGAYVVLPERNSLLVALNEEREVASDHWWALFCVANKRYGNAYIEDRGSRQLFAFSGRKAPRAVPWPQRWAKFR